MTLVSRGLCRALSDPYRFKFCLLLASGCALLRDDWFEMRNPWPYLRAASVDAGSSGAMNWTARQRLTRLARARPALAQAMDDRLRLRAVRIGEWLAPLLAASVWPHLGVSLDQMRPIDRISATGVPKLLSVGSADQHTPLQESMALYQVRQRRSNSGWWPVQGMWILIATPVPHTGSKF